MLGLIFTMTPVVLTLQAQQTCQGQQKKGDSMFQPDPFAFSVSAEEQRQARCVARSAVRAGESAQEKGGVCRGAAPATEKNRAMEDKQGEGQSSRGGLDIEDDKVSRKSYDPACEAEGVNPAFNFSASFAGMTSSKHLCVCCEHVCVCLREYLALSCALDFSS
jgi:hypothetical protein